MLRLGVILCVLSVSHAWLNLPWGDVCRQSAGMGRRIDRETEVVQIVNSCKQGTIEWHYPREGVNIEVRWNPASGGDFKVCLLPSSMIDMLKGARDGSGTDLDLTKLERRAQSDEGEKVCVQSENDAATILFLGGEWGYMQVIDYEIQ